MRWSLALFLLSCTRVQITQMHEKRDVANLGLAASAYWDALRWNNIGGATAFIQTPEERLKLGSQLSEPKVRITDADVLQVEVGEELGDDRLPECREGVARI